MLPENLPPWAIFFTAPLTAYLLFSAFLFCGNTINPEFTNWLRAGSQVTSMTCAAVLTGAVWFVHNRVFMKGIRESQNAEQEH